MAGCSCLSWLREPLDSLDSDRVKRLRLVRGNDAVSGVLTCLMLCEAIGAPRIPPTTWLCARRTESPELLKLRPPLLGSSYSGDCIASGRWTV